MDRREARKQQSTQLAQLAEVMEALATLEDSARGRSVWTLQSRRLDNDEEILRFTVKPRTLQAILQERELELRLALGLGGIAEAED